MGYMSEAEEFIDACASARTLHELSIPFARIIGDMGYDMFSCLTLANLDNLPKDAVVLVEYPQEWMVHYMDQRYETCDKVLKVALQQNLPFFWNEPRVTHGMTKIQRQIFEEAGEMGFVQGLTVPIHARGTHPATVNVVSEHRDVDPSTRNAIHLMAVYLHEAALRIVRRDRGLDDAVPRHLTDRERECLRWASAGKTDWEIGRILGVSENTVHYHIEGAKRRLNVSTRVQAVVNSVLENQHLP